MIRNQYALRQWRKQQQPGYERWPLVREAIDVSDPLAIKLQLPIRVVSCHDWPTGDDRAFTRMKRDHRRGTHRACARALHALEWYVNTETGKHPGLHERVEALEFWRIAPKALDDDGLVQAFHHHRDGVWDCLVGYSIDKNGERRWQGSAKDTRNSGISHHYDEGPSGDLYGMQVIFRMRA